MGLGPAAGTKRDVDGAALGKPARDGRAPRGLEDVDEVPAKPTRKEKP